MPTLFTTIVQRKSSSSLSLFLYAMGAASFIFLCVIYLGNGTDESLNRFPPFLLAGTGIFFLSGYIIGKSSNRSLILDESKNGGMEVRIMKKEVTEFSSGCLGSVKATYCETTMNKGRKLQELYLSFFDEKGKLCLVLSAPLLKTPSSGFEKVPYHNPVNDLTYFCPRLVELHQILISKF